uniref:Ig-like domain-containing protein n=1 Tax=Paramormyrops kingsleyae TaxID=1676925 RepID=A0A3B3SLE0_9TELE
MDLGLLQDTVMWKIFIYLFTTGVSTVTGVTVQRGGSVTIPCVYSDRYKTHVKYWCRGRELRPCFPIVHSDSPQEGNVSIRDDPDQRVFTVTINSLTAGDSGYYWCGVKISGGTDVGDQVYLSVTEGKMSVLQTVLVETGGSVGASHLQACG